MEYIYSLFIISFDTLSLINIAEASRKDNRKQSIKIWLLYIGIVFVISNFVVTTTSLFKSIIMIIIATIALDIIYEGSKLSKAFSAIMWYIFLVTSEYIILMFLITCFGIGTEEIFENVFVFTVYSILSRFIIFFLTFLFKKIKRKNTDLGVRYWIQIIIFPTVSVFTCLILMDNQLNTPSVSIWFFVDAVGLIMANVIILTLINQLDEEAKIKSDNILLNQQIKMEMSNIQAIMDAYAVQRKMTHDFENHLHVVQSLAQQNNDLQTVEYTKNMLKQISANSLVVRSNNNVVDAILNQKYMVAQKNGIVVEFKINDLSSIKVANEDMVTILANALDNAINAAKETEDKKYIKITILNKESETLIAISNTVKENVIIKNNSVENAKKDIEHGYGLQNIRAVVEKYESMFTIDCKDKVFTILAIFYKRIE